GVGGGVLGWLVARGMGRADASALPLAAVAAALLLLAVAAYGTFAAIAAIARAGILADALAATTHVTAMIFAILIGATMFSLVFRGLGGDEMVQRTLAALPAAVAHAILPALPT